jgi:antitoxin FitA
LIIGDLFSPGMKCFSAKLDVDRIPQRNGVIYTSWQFKPQERMAGMPEACYYHAMSSVQVKNVEPELHDALRQRASHDGKTMSEYVLDLIRRDLRKPSRQEWIERVRRLEPVEVDYDVVAAIEADRESRLDT